MNIPRKSAIVIAAVAMLLLLTSCAAGPNTAVEATSGPAGFWMGVWQGLIVPITFFISLFTDNVNMYEVNNNGNWYDFGFFLGIGGLASGFKAFLR